MTRASAIDSVMTTVERCRNTGVAAAKAMRATKRHSRVALLKQSGRVPLGSSTRAPLASSLRHTSWSSSGCGSCIRGNWAQGAAGWTDIVLVLVLGEMVVVVVMLED